MECEEGMRNKQKKNHFSPISAFKRKIICNVRFFPMLKKKKNSFTTFILTKKKRIQLTKQINFFSEKKNQTKIRQNNKKKKKRTFLFNLNPPLLCVCAQREKTSTDLVN